MTANTEAGSIPTDRPIGVILVDHGSRLEEANQMLETVATRFKTHSALLIVEPAHMELAEPDIGQAFDRCVAQGALHVVVVLFFLSPGRHSRIDIPRMTEEAASRHPGVTYSITRPLGDDAMLHPLLLNRITEVVPPDNRV